MITFTMLSGLSIPLREHDIVCRGIKTRKELILMVKEPNYNHLVFQDNLSPGLTIGGWENKTLIDLWKFTGNAIYKRCIIYRTHGVLREEDLEDIALADMALGGFIGTPEPRTRPAIPKKPLFNQPLPLP